MVAAVRILMVTGGQLPGIQTRPREAMDTFFVGTLKGVGNHMGPFCQPRRTCNRLYSLFCRRKCHPRASWLNRPPVAVRFQD